MGMRVRLVRGRHRAAAVACLVAFSVGGLAGCAAGRAASERSSSSRPSIGPVETIVRVLKTNLCNSGRAACCTGGSAVSVAVALVHQHRPQMKHAQALPNVRVLEVCEC